MTGTLRGHDALALGLGLIGILLAAGCAYGPPRTAPTLTKIEAREMGESGAARIALDQLYEVLEPARFPDTPRPQTALSDMWFTTAPRSTRVSDLCQSEIVLLEFDPVERDRGAETRVRASGLSASRRFHFLAAPESPHPNYVSSEMQRTANERCARTDVRADHYFYADDEQIAVHGFWLSEAVFGQYARDPLEVELSCQSDEAACRALVDRAQVAGLDRVSRCDVGGCVIATFDDVQLAIYSEGSGQRTALSRVEVWELIIFADERID